MLKPEKKEKKH